MKDNIKLLIFFIIFPYSNFEINLHCCRGFKTLVQSKTYNMQYKVRLESNHLFLLNVLFLHSIFRLFKEVMSHIAVN
jgi:hypothetical protein